MRPGQKEFLVWQEGIEEREDAELIVAFDHEDAAENWAVEYDAIDDDYTIAQGSPELVYVALNENDSISGLYEVSCEALRQYYAYLIEEEK